MGEIQPGDFVRMWGVPDTLINEWTWVYCQVVTGEYAMQEGWLFHPEFMYKESSTREIPIVHPLPPTDNWQKHTFTVTIESPAPIGDIIANWVRLQLNSSREMTDKLVQSAVRFDIQES